MEELKDWYKKLLNDLNAMLPDSIKELGKQPHVAHDQDEQEFYDNIDLLDSILLSDEKETIKNARDK
jgi:hypothetical protein